MIDADWRSLAPKVLGILVRRGAPFAAAEDAVQEALLEAVRHWQDDVPAAPLPWLVTTARRKLVDEQRSEIARRWRELRDFVEPEAGPAEAADDTLRLLFLCCHPTLSDAAAVALTLRAVGGLTTRQIAEAYLVPEATMAQRISRAKKAVSGQSFDTAGDLGRVLTVLYLVFNQGHSGELDLATEAIRLTRQLAAVAPAPEVSGLLALMLLHHARRSARWTERGDLVPLAEQDRSRWDTALIQQGIAILSAALHQDRLGSYQCQAAIAALHADAPSTAATDWQQILGWYDELLGFTDSPVVALNRAVVVGELEGPAAGLRAAEAVPVGIPRRTAVLAHLHERAGHLDLARDLYGEAAASATSVAERRHLTKQAARLLGSSRPVPTEEPMTDPPSVLFSSGQFGHHTYRIPALVDTPHGLVVFVEGRRSGAGDAGEIELIARRSPDGGRTWSEPVVVAGRPGYTWGNPAPVVVNDEIVLLSCTNGANADETAICRGTVSAEHTRRVQVQRIGLPDLTAGPPSDITSTVKSPGWGWYATGPGHALRLRRGPFAGRLVVAANHSIVAEADLPSRYSGHLLLSDDDGDTWRIGAVEPGTPTLSGPNESCAAELGDGEIVVTIRNQAQGPGQVSRGLFRSADGGITGTLAAQPEIAMPRVQASITTLTGPDGNEHLVLCGPSDPDRRARLALRRSADGGRTWGAPLVVAPGPAAYSDLAVSGDGRLHVVWECGETGPYEKVRHAVYDVADLLAH